MDIRESDFDSDTNENCNEEIQLVGPVDGKFEFENTELEELVLLEGPQQILQLTLQQQADDLMKEEITNADDYADWFDGLLMQSRESRPSQEQQMVQKCLCYCKFSIWTSLTLTTAFKSDWMTIVRRIRGGARFARRCELTRI
jgi:hypothetical protein